jgi:hypothetical protein
MLKGLLIMITVSVSASLPAFAMDSPETVYQKYSAALKSKNLDELNKYLSKHQKDKLDAETPEDRLKIIELVAAFMPKSIRVVEQSISPDDETATLRLVGIGGISGKEEVSGKVTMVKEDSEWKIEREEWSSNKQP